MLLIPAVPGWLTMPAASRYAHPATLIWFVVFTAAVTWIFLNARFNTDLTRFLPVDDSVISSIISKQLNQGSASRSLFITISGKDPAALASISNQIVKRLEQSGNFLFVSNGTMPIPESDKKWLFDNRYLMSTEITPQHFSVENLRKTFLARLEEVRSPLSMISGEYLPADPTAVFLNLLANWQRQKQPEKINGVLFSQDHKTSFIIAQTVAPGWDVTQQEKVIGLIESVFNELHSKNSALQLAVTGTGFFSVSSKRQIESESQLFSIIATATLVMLLFFLYRSPRHILLSTLPLLSAVVAGTATVLLIQSQIHGITLAFGITLLGMTIDYPVHVFSHPQKRDKLFWRTLYSGALTTIIAFSVFFYSGIPGLTELGLFTTGGITAAVLVTRWLIPHWLPRKTIVDDRTAGTKLKNINILPFSYSVSLSTRIVTALMIAVFAGFAFHSGSIEWEDELSVFSPLPENILQQHQTVLEQLGIQEKNRYSIAIHDNNINELLIKAEKLDKQLKQARDGGLLDDYDTPSRYLPSIETQKKRQSSIPELQVLEQRIEQALTGLPFKPDLFKPFLADTQNARLQQPITLETIQSTLIREKLDSMLFKTGTNTYTAILPLSGIRQEQALVALLKSEPIENTVFLDMKQQTSDMLKSIRSGAGEKILLGILLIFITLFITIGDLNRITRVIFSLVLTLTLVLATLVQLQINLSLFHFISLLLVLGIGLDYALFFSLGERGGHKRINTGIAIAICAVSTIMVFGILSFSQLYVLKAIGLTTALGAIAAWVSTFVFAQPLRAKGKAG